MKLHRKVQSGLAAKSRKKRIRTFATDDFRQRLCGKRFNVSTVGKIRVRHDGRRVRIDQDDFVAFGFQRFARLNTGVVEFASLTDDDRAGTDEHDFFEIFTFWHSTFAWG